MPETRMTVRSALMRNLRMAAVAVLTVAAASAIGQIATFPNLAPWYAGLNKPEFNPPNWVFGPVWTLLFALMAYAVWRILKRPSGSADRRLGLTLFFVQLALNPLWSWAFFGARNPGLGLINIVPQFLVIVATMVVFNRMDRVAALCMLPLAAWVGFASILNFAVWRLN